MSQESKSHLTGLPFESRLHWSWEYRRFFENKESFALSECTVFRTPNDLAYPRLGISLKAKGLSVHRNQVKRCIREFFRQTQSHLGSYDYLFLIPWYKKLPYPYPFLLKQCLREQFFKCVL